MTLAILAKAGLQNKLVHYDFNDHIGESTSNGENQMRTSAFGARDRFGFPNVFYDDIQNLGGAVNNLKNAINASASGDRLFVILAGPAEVLWRAMNQANAGKRQFVTVVSHSFFNEFHANNQHAGQPNHGQPNHTQLTHTITDVQNLGAQFIRIANQNDYWNTHLGGRGGFGALDWIQNHPDANFRWVYTRIQAVGRADYSDAGMAYYLITGNDTANTATQESFFQGAFPGSGGGGITPPSGYTQLEFRHSTKCMDNKGLTANGSEYHQWSCGANANRNFRFEARGGGWWNIRSQKSNRCLDLASGDVTDGAKLHQWDCSTSNPNQSWKLVDQGGGWFNLVSQKSDKCVDVSGVSTANQAKIHQWSCHGGNNQQMKFR